MVLQKMRIAVVGGGVAGICAVHHIIKSIPNVEVVGFEASDDTGGTWVYTDKTEVDEFGIPLATSMYKSLRTNLPKQVMEFSDFPIPKERKTFMEDEEYLQYLNDYVEKYDIKKHYKFRHLVTLVKPRENVWDVKYKNILTDDEFTDEYDYVFVCNGHYSKQVIPEYQGLDNFKGRQLHSHNYRTPDRFKNRKVLIIGSGPSGLDISLEVARFAKTLYLSHHYSKLESPFPPNYIQKPDVEGFTENSAIFSDGSSEDIDDILFCTGYSYYCPFLDSECGLEIERTHMGPLYKQIVNVEHPTMFFIGIPQLCCIIPMSDMQVRYAVAAITGRFKLPSKEAMLAHIEMEYNRKDKTAFKKARIATHMMGIYEPIYYEELAKESGITSVPIVFCELRFSTMETKKNLYAFRDYNYHIIDDEHYIRTYKEGTDEEWNTIRGVSKSLTKKMEKMKLNENGKLFNETMLKP